jgi:oligopeptide transport system substrate-binding protein
VDRERIVKDVLGGVNPAANCIVPPGVFGHRDGMQGIIFDPDRARSLLAAAGHPNGVGLPEIEISYRTNRPDMRLVAEAVGQELSKNLGLKVDYQAVEWGKLLKSFNKKQVPFVVMRWSADFLDAQNFLTNLLGSEGNGNNFSYRNPKFDKLCDQADSEDEPATRQKLYGQAEDIALSDAVMIPICFEQDAELISPHLRGVRNCLVAHLPYTGVTTR